MNFFSAVLMVFLGLLCYKSLESKRVRQMSAVDETVYETLLRLTEGKFDVPVKKRSTKQKSACVRYWRNKTKFSIEIVKGQKKLCFEGKEVLKKSDLDRLVTKEFKHCKGIGARKLKHRLLKTYQGASEPLVQKILLKSKLNQKLNARFTNKAIIRPVRASAVQVSLLFICFAFKRSKSH